MSTFLCTKCYGPVIVKDGNYVCALCNEAYGQAEAIVAKDFSHFYEKTSLADLQKIGRHFHDLVIMSGIGKNQNDARAVYTIAPLSNGQYYTRFIPSAGYNSIYRGQCAVENWCGAKSIYASEEYTVAIAEDGTLQPTLIEVEELFQRIKNSGLSDMRMKQIVSLNYKHSFACGDITVEMEDSFLGLDVNGKVAMFNPFELFFLDANNEEDREKCAKLINSIRSWPAVDKLYAAGQFLIGVTESGKVYAVPAASYSTKDDEEVAKTLSQWDNIESIIFTFDVSATVFIGLKKDGTLISNQGRQITDCYLDQDISTLQNIVQIQFQEFNGKYTKLAYLTSQGEYYFFSTKINENVISILSRGYVRADGSVYELVREEGNVYEPIQGLRLFHSVETAADEMAESTNGFLTWKRNLGEEHQIVLNDLQAKRKELSALNDQYAKLGLFKVKEKKALRPLIDNLSQEAKKLESETSRIDAELRSAPNGKPTWHSLGASDGQTYSISQISSAAHQAVSYKKPEASVLGSAAVGALIAGPAGAIVGAIYAADKNRKR